MSRLIDHIGLILSIAVVIAVMASCETSSNVDSPYSKYFMRYYGGDGYQVAADMIAVGDGNYFLLGTSSSIANLDLQTDSKIYLVEVDKFGNLLNEYFLGEPGDIAKDIEATQDGNFIILADHRVSSSNTDIKLIRITRDVAKLDSVIYGSLGLENGKSVTALEDDGFIVTGATEYDSTILLNPGNPDDFSDIFHYRCNSSLQFDDFNWYEQEGPGTLDFGTKSFELNSNEYYVFGSSNQYHSGNPDGKMNLYYSSLDGGGITRNFNFLGDFQLNTESAFVDEVPVQLGGGYLFIGSKLYPTGASSLHAVRLRSNLNFSAGDEVWDREIPIEARNLTAVSGVSAVNGVFGYLILGTEVGQNDVQNIWLTKIDLNGNLLWSRAFGSHEEDDFAASIMEIEDGRIFVLGTVNLINGQSKLTLFKLNEQGQLME